MENLVKTDADLREELETLRAWVKELNPAEDASRLRAIAATAGAMAHDINNLVGAILGNVALLRTELGKDSNTAAMLESIEEAAEKAAEVVQRLLAFTQQGPQRLERVNLNTIAYHMLLVEEQELAPRIRISRYVDPDLWDVNADYKQLTQMAISLARNAVEAIQNEGRIIIRTRNLELDEQFAPEGSGLTSGRYVLLSVEDNGVPTASETLAKGLEQGERAAPAQDPLALAAVFAMAKEYQGYLTVKSEQGQGNVCQVYLPACRREEKPLVLDRGEAPVGTETVLIVDDNQAILDVIEAALKRLGYRTLRAKDGLGAIEIARTYEGDIHLTLLDMAMPAMGGVEAYPELKRVRPDMAVIVCTGIETEAASDALLEAGANAVLHKPFRPSVLAHEIRRVLDSGV
ncbi:MAG TPA: response regulator [Candidatus Hydrogenedentes bacterium]|nr:response regulator [Candidatus Hydrogenedentota bacterium]HIJ72716.1 response regulator [Candidatus Hydrogenedentota bacterium]